MLKICAQKGWEGQIIGAASHCRSTNLTHEAGREPSGALSHEVRGVAVLSVRVSYQASERTLAGRAAPGSALVSPQGMNERGARKGSLTFVALVTLHAAHSLMPGNIPAPNEKNFQLAEGVGSCVLLGSTAIIITILAGLHFLLRAALVFQSHLCGGRPLRFLLPLKFSCILFWCGSLIRLN
jgi:hypothetical protein